MQRVLKVGKTAIFSYEIVQLAPRTKKAVMYTTPVKAHKLFKMHLASL